MSPKRAIAVLERRRAYLQKNYDTGYFSPGKGKDWVAAELSALRRAIEALSTEGARENR